MRAADLEHFAPVKPMNAEDHALALEANGYHGAAGFIRSREALLAEAKDRLIDCVNLLALLEPEVRGGYSPDGAMVRGRIFLSKLEAA